MKTDWKTVKETPPPFNKQVLVVEDFSRLGDPPVLKISELYQIIESSDGRDFMWVDQDCTNEINNNNHYWTELPDDIPVKF